MCSLLPAFEVIGAVLVSERFHNQFRSTDEADEFTQNVLVIGSPQQAEPYLRSLRRGERKAKVSFLTLMGSKDSGSNGSSGIEGVGVLYRILDERVVDEVVVVAPTSQTLVHRIGLACAERGLTFTTLVTMPTVGVGRCRAISLDHANFLFSVHSVPHEVIPLFIKRTMDILGALVGLCLFAAAYVWYGWRIPRQTGSSVIFRQRRLGRNGRPFTLYKFRTMYFDAETRLPALFEKNEMKGQIFKIADDPRITPLGRMLRRHHIDELPQFWNVLRGDMSLVGTRPPTPEEVSKYQVTTDAD